MRFADEPERPRPPRGTRAFAWVATYNGDSSNNSVTSSASAEPVTITKATPSISTQQQPASASVGSSIADQATVSGGDSPTGTVTFSLYSNANGTGTPLFTDTETLSGGVATSKGYKTTATGTDYWVATYNGDANNSPVSSGTSAEPVTITTASKLADVSVAISGPSSAADASSFSELVTVKNAGPASAGNVLGAVLVPAGTTVTSTGGGTLGFGAVHWTASQINAGAKVTYTITFKVSAHASGKADPRGHRFAGQPRPQLRQQRDRDHGHARRQDDSHHGTRTSTAQPARGRQAAAGTARS